LLLLFVDDYFVVVVVVVVVALIFHLFSAIDIVISAPRPLGAPMPLVGRPSARARQPTFLVCVDSEVYY
jgi:hypothetical protein